MELVTVRMPLDLRKWIEREARAAAKAEGTLRISASQTVVRLLRSVRTTQRAQRKG